MGDSAGGTLATVTAMALRDQQNPHLRGQILVYPITDHVDAGAASYAEFAEGYGLTRDGMRWFMRHYIADPADATDTRVCPVRTADAAPAAADLRRDRRIRRAARRGRALRRAAARGRRRRDLRARRGPAPRVHPPVRDPRGARAVDRSHRGVDASRGATGRDDPQSPAGVGRCSCRRSSRPRPRGAQAAPHIVLVGDSTVTEGSGWGLGFRQLVAGDVVVTNTAQNGRSSKSFRDEGHWATAIAAKGDYYLIQFGHNDQPGKGPERETDPATTFPANMARYVDEVRAIGATPILVTSLVRRTFSETEPGEADVDARAVGRGGEARRRGEARAADRSRRVEPCVVRTTRSCRRPRASTCGPTPAPGTPRTSTPPAAWPSRSSSSQDLRRAVPALAPWLIDDPEVGARAPAGRSAALPAALAAGAQRRAACHSAGSTRDRSGWRWPSAARSTTGARSIRATLPPVDHRARHPGRLGVRPGYKGQVERPGCGFAADAPTRVSVRVLPGWTESADGQPHRRLTPILHGFASSSPRSTGTSGGSGGSPSWIRRV